jgi:hypothetical protein
MDRLHWQSSLAKLSAILHHVLTCLNHNKYDHFYLYRALQGGQDKYSHVLLSPMLSLTNVAIAGVIA